MNHIINHIKSLPPLIETIDCLRSLMLHRAGLVQSYTLINNWNNELRLETLCGSGDTSAADQAPAPAGSFFKQKVKKISHFGLRNIFELLWCHLVLSLRTQVLIDPGTVFFSYKLAPWKSNCIS